MGWGEGHTLVGDEGASTSRIVLVGEAPGTREVAMRRPFVGPSGARLADWWGRVGLRRSDIYITNFLPYQPARIDDISRDEAQHWTAALHERIAALPGPDGGGPVVIVPVGNYALYATCGLGRVSFHNRDGRWPRPGITSHRGSIYGPTVGGRLVKVIPSIHPAATFARGGKSRKRSAQWTRACIADWERIAGDSLYRELRLPQREHYIRPTLQDLRDFVEDARSAPKLSLDIETPRRRLDETLWRVGGVEGWGAGRPDGGEPVCYKSGKKKGQPKTRTRYGYPAIACIGFAISPSWSLTVPLTADYWHDELPAALALVDELLAQPTEKVMQNGLFDAYWLRSEGYEVANWVWDTRAMHHLLDPTALHSLEYLASIYTREPYWKDEAKDPDSATRYSMDNEAAFWTYCGKDTAVTLEIQLVLEAELRRRGALPAYHSLHSDRFEPLLAMSLRGMRVDEAERARQIERLIAERTDVEGALHTAAGVNLFGKTAVSDAKLKDFLYKRCGLPKQYTKDPKTGGKRVTTGEVALVRLRARYGERPVEGGTTIDDVCGAVLAHRGASKEIEALSSKVSDDGRMRSLYSPFTDSGRLSAQATPREEGRNLQNVARGPQRRIFVPDQ